MTLGPSSQGTCATFPETHSNALAPVVSDCHLDFYTMLIACILSAYGLWLVHRKLSLFYTSPGLHVLPGPPSPSWLYGNVRQACRAGNSPLTRQWLEKHGSNLFIRWLLMVSGLGLLCCQRLCSVAMLGPRSVDGRPSRN